MSMRNKLAEAESRGKVNERGRILWLISEIEAELHGALKGRILSEKAMHIATTKLRMFIGLASKLKRAIASDAKPADIIPDELPEEL